MVAVIKGDIIASKQFNPEIWQKKLKTYFSEVSVNDEKWAIYLGDSFRLKTPFS